MYSNIFFIVGILVCLCKTRAYHDGRCSSSIRAHILTYCRWLMPPGGGWDAAIVLLTLLAVTYFRLQNPRGWLQFKYYLCKTYDGLHTLANLRHHLIQKWAVIAPTKFFSKLKGVLEVFSQLLDFGFSLYMWSRGNLQAPPPIAWYPSQHS